MHHDSLAPVLIATHTRLDHLKRTIEALSSNLLANRTDLFIASDAARMEAEEPAVKRIREYIDKIDGFRSIKKIYRSENYGHFNNFQDATNQVFNEFNSIIKLEDDIVTAPGFLTFMNQGLLKYENDKRIISISGHLWPGINVQTDTILLPAANGWGWGIWKDRFYTNNHDSSLAQEFLRNPNLFLKMCLTNPSLLGMANAVAKNKLVAGDVSWALQIIKENKLVLFPGESLVRNIGFDGSGQNCNVNPEFHGQKISIKTNFIFEDFTSDEIKNSSNIIFKHYGGYRHMLYQITMYILQTTIGDKEFNRLRRIKNHIIGWIQ